LILGLSLDFKSLVKNYKISSIVAILKIIIFPLICVVILALLHVSKINIDISIIEASVPCGLVSVILVVNYNLDPKITSDTVILSILMSFITIPIILYIT